MLKLTIKTDNDAFTDDPGHELARLLRELAARLEAGDTAGRILDSHGNTVGTFTLNAPRRLSDADRMHQWKGQP